METWSDISTHHTVPQSPTYPPIQDYDIPFDAGTMVNGKPVLSRGARFRQAAIANGRYRFRWERLLQSRSSKKRKIEKYAAAIRALNVVLSSTKE